MPGIYGIVNGAASADLATKLAGMSARMKHHPWYVEEHYVDAEAGIAAGRLSLGFVNRWPQPVWNEDRSLLAFTAGELYDAEERRRELAGAGHVFSGESHAEILVHGYEDEGMAFFRRLHGTFTAAIWDARNRRLVLANDRFGMKPLYYAKLPGRLLFGSEIKVLLGDREVSRRLDPRGLAQFFTFGQFFGEDTLLEAVRILPGAGWLKYDAREDGVEVGRYWRLEPSVAKRSDAQFLDCVGDALERAVDRRVENTRGLGLSLSGGLDARTILAAIDDERVRVTSVSMGVEGSVDHRSAQRLAALAHQPHRCCVLNSRFLANFEEYLRQMVRLTDGQYLSQCIVMPTLPVYRELGIQVLLRGHAGELMHMDKAYAFSLDPEAFGLGDGSGLEDWLFGRLRRYLSAPVAGPLFASPRQDEIDALARESLRARLAESAGVEPQVQRISHLFITERLRRETALSMVKFGSLMETRLPYVDNDLIDLLLSAPPELKLSDRIQAHFLRRRRPAFLDVVNSNTGTRLGASRLARSFGRARLRVLGKLRVRGYQHYERLGPWLRWELRPLVAELLLSDRFLDRGIFTPETIRTAVEDHFSGKRNHTYLLLALMIFETGQRELIDSTGDFPSGAEPAGVRPAVPHVRVGTADRHAVP